jgi:hypothetical protein
VPQTFKVDQAATFDKVILLEIEPRKAYGSEEQERNRDGVLRWTAQVVAGFKAFDKTNNEVLKVGFDAEGDPRTSIESYTPVQLIDFELGVMPREKKNRETQALEMVGVTIWYRCSEIRPISASGSGRRSHLATAEAATG